MSQMNMPGPSAGAGNSNRPGQMTAVMRAMQVTSGPKVLRIGLVNAGRVLEERIIKLRDTVTVGPNEKSTFVVPFQQLGPQFKLFEMIGQDYHLNFTEQMTGRVALATGITDLNSLRGSAKRVNNVFQVKLSEEARGKVVLGDTTFLFQFVAPPPVQPRPQLPLAVQGGFGNQIDWTLTILAAFSFLIHFGFVGVMYSDWADRAVGDDRSIAGLDSLTKQLQIPPVVEEKPEPVDDKAKPDKPEKTDSKQAVNKPASGGPAGAAGPKGPATGAVSDNKAAALSQQADQMAMSLLGGLAGNSAVAGATNRSDIPPVDLAGAAASGAGVAAGSGELKMGGGAAINGGGGGKGLGGIGGATKGDGTGQTAGPETKTKGPVGIEQVGGSTASVPVQNASSVIAKMKGRFRQCYQRGLDSNPDMEGKVMMNVKIAPTGEVESVSASPAGGNLSPAVTSCLSGVTRGAQFEPPGGTGSSLQFPIAFAKQ